MKTQIFAILAAVVLFGALVGLALRGHAPRSGSVRDVSVPPVTEKATPQTTVPAAAPEPVVVGTTSPASQTIASAVTSTNQPAPKSSPRVREPLQDPDAREALTWVGADPEAEAYWLEAIFDPNLPAQEREDLMEDLNENGLSDPRHPGPEDVPLILNRLALIEEIAPYGDNFMQEHLGEAYKDLANLLAGEPPQ